MGMALSRKEAKREAIRRFGEGTSRCQDFMASYMGIRNKFHRSTVDEGYGYGRRSHKWRDDWPNSRKGK